MKKRTDKMRNADESNLMAGDKVLLKQLQPRANKWTVQFGTQQYALIDKQQWCGRVARSRQFRNTIYLNLYRKRDRW